jgi:hypothetical protein
LKKGWISIEKTPQAVMANKIKQENSELKERLKLLEDAVEQLSAKKGKK